MFGKALKYDMKAVWKLWWVIAVSVGVLSFISSLVLRFVISTSDKLEHASALLNLVWGMAIIFLFVSIMAIFASSIGTVILVLMRFYKNFFTDEGYLTFTLPVSRAKLFLAKITNAMIWTSLHGVLLWLCVMMAMLIAPPAENGALINTVVYRELGELFSLIFEGVEFSDVLWILLYAIEIMVMAFVSSLISVCLFHMCITIGSIVAKKAKVIAGIGIYYGVNMLFSTVFSIFGNLFTLGLIGGFMKLMSEIESQYSALAIVAVIFLLVIVILATVAVTMYLITLDMIKNKLNLT